MNLNQLIETYLVDPFSKSEASKFFQNDDNAEKELPQEVTSLLKKLYDQVEISDLEFDAFTQSLHKLDDRIQNSITCLAFNINLNIYKTHQPDIDSLINEIEEKIRQEQPITQHETITDKKYVGLTNTYRLALYNPKYLIGNLFPGVNSYQLQTMQSNIPFAINALLLTNKLPKTINYYGMDLSRPCYPGHLRKNNQNKVPLKKGIKDSDIYYPFKQVRKIVAGDTGDNTFIATNGIKLLFVRGTDLRPNAVFSSKIATLISAKHFSSERLLDNRLTAAKKLTSYAVSVADSKTRDQRKSYIEENSHVFPGSGIIDEVTNFVRETDPNVENYGFSSENVNESYLSKIDFDRCFPFLSSTKADYDNNILTKHPRGMYHGALFVQTEPGYIQEKLYARLKLALLTQPIFNNLAAKAYPDDMLTDKEKAVTECSKRAELALELFREHPEVEDFLNKNPDILNQCFLEIKDYINSHFDEEEQKNLMYNSLSLRAEYIKEQLNIASSIKLAPMMKSSSSRIQATPQPIDSSVPSKENANSFFSQHKSQLLSMSYLDILSTSLSILLMLTGIFFWAGVCILILTACGTAGYIGKLIYQDYQLNQSPEAMPSKEDEIQPSLRVQQLSEELSATRKEMTHLDSACNNMRHPSPHQAEEEINSQYTVSN